MRDSGGGVDSGQDDPGLVLVLDLPSAVSEEEVREYYQEHADAFTRNGQVQSLSAVRSQIEQALTEMRRAMLVEDWAGSLRRRAVVANLYFTRQ